MREVSLIRPAGGGRLEWMDLLRGTAIILVLLWHAPAIPQLFGWPVPGWLAAANNFFLPFRMPTLMFLSGLLLPQSLKKNWRDYYLGKIQTLAWPYLIWTLIYFTQYEPIHPLYHWRAWYATGYLWFLFFITVYYFIAPAVTKLPMWLTPWLFMIASIPLGESIEKRLLYFATFFFLGYWLAMRPNLLRLISGWRAALLGAVALAWGVTSAIHGLDLAYRGEFAVLDATGVLAACWVAAQARGRWMRPVCFVGRHSLVYYVAHFPAMTLVVFAVLALGWQMSPWIWLVNLIVGAAAATVLALGDRRPPLAWLFRMPEPMIGWLRPRSSVATPGRDAVAPSAQTAPDVDHQDESRPPIGGGQQ